MYRTPGSLPLSLPLPTHPHRSSRSRSRSSRAIVSLITSSSSSSSSNHQASSGASISAADPCTLLDPVPLRPRLQCLCWRQYITNFNCLNDCINHLKARNFTENSPGLILTS